MVTYRLGWWIFLTWALVTGWNAVVYQQAEVSPQAVERPRNDAYPPPGGTPPEKPPHSGGGGGGGW